LKYFTASKLVSGLRVGGVFRPGWSPHRHGMIATSKATKPKHE
jgi:hypothetical protein